MNKLSFLGIFLALSFIQCATYSEQWTSFPACHMGRLQSPIRLNVTESTFINKFSIDWELCILPVQRKLEAENKRLREELEKK